MAELVAEYWIYAVLALIVGLLVAWWIVAANRKTTVALDRTDGATVRRNQALIDAPAAQAGASIPPPTPEGLAGVGEVIDASTTAAAAGRDDLKRIKGIGPKVERLLHGLGVTTFAEIAAWDDADVDRFDAQLGSFAGRIRRDDWRAQAALLAAEDTAAYEAKFGKL